MLMYRARDRLKAARIARARPNPEKASATQDLHQSLRVWQIKCEYRSTSRRKGTNNRNGLTGRKAVRQIGTLGQQQQQQQKHIAYITTVLSFDNRYTDRQISDKAGLAIIKGTLHRLALRPRKLDCMAMQSR